MTKLFNQHFIPCSCYCGTMQLATRIGSCLTKRIPFWGVFTAPAILLSLVISSVDFGTELEGQFTPLRTSCSARCCSVVSCVTHAWNTSLFPYVEKGSNSTCKLTANYMYYGQPIHTSSLKPHDALTTVLDLRKRQQFIYKCYSL
jgi:hypothetical protein